MRCLWTDHLGLHSPSGLRDFTGPPSILFGSAADVLLPVRGPCKRTAHSQRTSFSQHSGTWAEASLGERHARIWSSIIQPGPTVAYTPHEM